MKSRKEIIDLYQEEKEYLASNGYETDEQSLFVRAFYLGINEGYKLEHEEMQTRVKDLMDFINRKY